jgi:hypothetical protein
MLSAKLRDAYAVRVSRSRDANSPFNFDPGSQSTFDVKATSARGRYDRWAGFRGALFGGRYRMDSDPPIETTAMKPQEDSGCAISVATAYALMFGRQPSPDVLAALHENLGTIEIRDTGGLRRIIMCLDRQVHVTAATVRFGSAELQKISVEGITLLVDTADVAVSQSILQEGTYEAHLTRVFRRYVRPGWRVVDVGANVGYYSMLAASLVGPQGEVLAFDPNSENARWCY